MGGTMSTTAGEIAYDAFSAALGAPGVWLDLPPARRAAWVAGANAAVWYAVNDVAGDGDQELFDRDEASEQLRSERQRRRG